MKSERRRHPRRYVAVGNEPFLKTYEDTYVQTIFSVLQNIQAALIKVGLGPRVKATIPLNADVYQTDNGMPSGGDFRPGIRDLMVSIIKFLSDNNSPLIVNIYLFSLIDEDAKSTEPGNFERHWGVFYYDGSLKYQLDLGSNRNLVPARGVKYLPQQWCVMAPQASLVDPSLADSISYACQFADCTSLGPGSSCSVLDSRGNASYAFNKYYQTINQSAGSCQFNDLATTTTTNPPKATADSRSR